MKILLVFSMIVTAGCSAAFAGGADQLSLGMAWEGGPLAGGPMGKVIYNVPADRQKLNLTFIVTGGAKNAQYQVGFDMICAQVDCADMPLLFGVPQWGYMYPNHGVPTRIFVLGTLTTDADGDGSVHFNLTNLPKGTFPMVYWVGLLPAGVLAPSAATSTLMEPLNAERLTL
jgi:hypothetical protein